MGWRTRTSSCEGRTTRRSSQASPFSPPAATVVGGGPLFYFAGPAYADEDYLREARRCLTAFAAAVRPLRVQHAGRAIRLPIEGKIAIPAGRGLLLPLEYELAPGLTVKHATVQLLNAVVREGELDLSVRS